MENQPYSAPNMSAPLQQNEPKSRTGLWIIIVILIALAAGAWFYFYPKDEVAPVAPAPIENTQGLMPPEATPPTPAPAVSVEQTAPDDTAAVGAVEQDLKSMENDLADVDLTGL